MITFEQFIGEKIVTDYSKENTNTMGAFVFGRMNPPTIGHEKLIKIAVQLAEEQGRDLFVFLSSNSPTHIVSSRQEAGQNMQATHRKAARENPLEYDFKINLLANEFKNVKFVDDKMAGNPFGAGYWMRDHGFKDVVLFCGEDRVAQYEAQFRDYVTEWADDPENLSFRFDKFGVQSLGMRSGDSSDPTEAASGTQARAYAVAYDPENHEQTKDNLKELQIMLVGNLPESKVKEIAAMIRDVDLKYPEKVERGWRGY